MAFDPKRHMMRVQGGREYLPVAARLVWFREEHPDWGIVTTPVEINLEKQYAIFSASIFNAEGKLMATATKMENVRGFADYVEKSETGAVGRALAYCGFGTQFAPELEESNRIADAPFPPGGRPGYPMPDGRSGARPGAPAGGFGMGGNRPAPARNLERDPEPARGGGAGVEEAPEEQPAPAARVAERPAPARPMPAPAPPRDKPAEEREALADEEDPFTETGEPARPAAPPARAAAARAAAPSAGSVNAPDEGGVALTGNRCSVEGCPAVLTQGQLNMSTNKFGKALCPLHQREATPVAGATPKRPGAKPEMAETLL